ncbi:MAG: hypothetical protein QM487_02830 [Candidatus Marithrix sp.]
MNIPVLEHSNAFVNIENNIYGLDSELLNQNNFDNLIDLTLPAISNELWIPPLNRCDAMLPIVGHLPTNPNLRPPTPISPQLNKVTTTDNILIESKFEGLFHKVSYKMQTPHVNQSIIIKRDFLDPGFDPFNHYYVTSTFNKNSQCDVFQIQLDDAVEPNPVLNVGIICGEWKVLSFRFSHSVHFA